MKARRPKPVAQTRFDPYGWDVLIFTERAKHRGFVNSYEPGGIAARITNGTNGMCSTIWKQNTIAIGVFNGSMATLVHELVHAIFAVLETAGVPTKYDNSEVFAYHMDHLFDWARNALNDASAS